MPAPEFYELRDYQQQSALVAVADVNALVVPTRAGPRFVALFDGTNNSVHDSAVSPGIDEQQTLIGRLFRSLEAGSESDSVRYLGGPGAKPLPAPGDSAVPTGSAFDGSGSIERAEYMYRQLVRWAQDNAALLQAGLPLQIDTMGFSRGAAIARHFMNIVSERGIRVSDDPESEYLVPPGGMRFSALLLDTVATGQLQPNHSELKLGIPATADTVLHLVAQDELRGAFQYTSILGDGPSDPRLHEILRAPVKTGEML